MNVMELWLWLIAMLLWFAHVHAGSRARRVDSGTKAANVMRVFLSDFSY
jgi:uncharacterized membrane protein